MLSLSHHLNSNFPVITFDLGFANCWVSKREKKNNVYFLKITNRNSNFNLCSTRIEKRSDFLRGSPDVHSSTGLWSFQQIHYRMLSQGGPFPQRVPWDKAGLQERTEVRGAHILVRRNEKTRESRLSYIKTSPPAF
jgi:hypothetical protein